MPNPAQTPADIDAILADPRLQAAFAALEAGHDRFVEEIVELTEIPAPPFKEAVRAAAYLEKFRALGLQDCTIDAEGNVTGLRRGRGNGGLIVAAAHLDTVFPEGTDVTVRREGTKLFAPGVGDDTRGLATLLAFIRALDAGGIETVQDILFVGDVGEEGKGDLRGIRHLFTASAHKDRIEGFFSFDGIHTADLVTSAVGSLRHRVTFSGPGGHSLNAFGTANPGYALGAFLQGMAGLEVPAEPLTTFSAAVFGGGTSINAIPEEAFVEIDLRSVSGTELARLDARVHEIAEAAAAAETARATTGRIGVSWRALGNRPAGETAPGTRLRAVSEAAIRALGFELSVKASSTDANIPMSLGIPAVTVGTGGDGGRAHSLEEWIDVAEGPSLQGQKAGLLALVGAAGISG
ncbi:M20/M25/M40 family metallo-hydrolase [Frigidibacter sp. MR17.24]|uniref:M20/M25/M40 family metallo-hydrolase n=1 Tax=Frigidibacter sp. MR17.24 TaxID=3127345 RepID=UPI003012EFFA